MTTALKVQTVIKPKLSIYMLYPPQQELTKPVQWKEWGNLEEEQGKTTVYMTSEDQSELPENFVENSKRQKYDLFTS